MPKIQHGRPTREASPAPQRAKVAEAAPARSASLWHLAPGAIVQRAMAGPYSLRPAELMAMQRTLGNRAAGAMLARSPVQAKLTVRAPGDEYEREADRVADAMMRAPPASLPNEGRTVEISPLVMAKPAPEHGDDGSFAAGEEFAQRLQASRGRGRALPPSLRETFETRFGADFSTVRIHSGAEAAALNQEIQAQAFTRGSDIFLGADRSAADTIADKRLLAHELTHVVQQGVAAPKTVTVPRRVTQSGIAGSKLGGQIQRNGVKAEPQVLKLPQEQIAAQDAIVAKLNSAIEEKKYTKWDVFGLGIIEILDLDTKRGELKDSKKMPIQWRSLNTDRYDRGNDLVAGDDDIKKKIVKNVMDTMDQAGQIGYLKSLELSNQEWAILAEVHYYYTRPQESYVFHKDTIGDTLFVNLNYLNEHEMAGPEYLPIPDPALETEHLEYIKKNLPEKFLKDLSSARKDSPSSEIMEAKKVPPKGVVSFVDELIYHATPLVGRRTVLGKQLLEFVKDKWYVWYGPASNLREELKTTKSETEFNMDEVRGSGLGLTEDEIEQLFTKHSVKGVRQKVSIPGGRDVTGNPRKGVEPPVASGRGPLTRRMSIWAKKGELPRKLAEGKKRQFFRTWVRAVKRTNLGQNWA